MYTYILKGIAAYMQGVSKTMLFIKVGLTQIKFKFFFILWASELSKCQWEQLRLTEWA